MAFYFFYGLHSSSLVVLMAVDNFVRGGVFSHLSDPAMGAFDSGGDAYPSCNILADFYDSFDVNLLHAGTGLGGPRVHRRDRFDSL